MKKTMFDYQDEYDYINSMIGKEMIRLEEEHSSGKSFDKRMSTLDKMMSCTKLIAAIDSDHKVFLLKQFKKKTKQFIDDAIDDSINHARRFVEAIK